MYRIAQLLKCNYDGYVCGYHWFTDVITKSTFILPDDSSVDQILAAVAKIRKLHNKTLKPEISRSTQEEIYRT